MREMAYAGLHERVLSFLPNGEGQRCLDLGAGTGALAVRLRDAGWKVEAADIDPDNFEADVPFHQLDLDRASDELPGGVFDLVTAVEIIEHLENPTNLLRVIAHALAPDGLAVVTTPNVDSLPARVKFALTGRIRAMDEWGDPTHITPIFADLLPRLLNRAGLRMVARHQYPEHGIAAGNPRFRSVVNLIDRASRGRVGGDTNIWMLGR